jgi:hypothetical protein
LLSLELVVVSDLLSAELVSDVAALESLLLSLPLDLEVDLPL